MNNNSNNNIINQQLTMAARQQVSIVSYVYVKMMTMTDEEIRRSNRVQSRDELTVFEQTREDGCHSSK